MSEVWRHLHKPLLSLSLCQLIDRDRFVDRSSNGSGASPASCETFVLLLTVVKALRRRRMQLAGYFCPTTEEVAGESQDPASPPKNIPPSLPPSLSPCLSPATSNETREKSRQWRVDPSRAFCPCCLYSAIIYKI